MIWKGVDGILRALARLPDDRHFVVCGDGEELQSWQSLARELGVERRVHWQGNVPHAKIATYIAAADVFVLNSNYEGLSHTLLEVMYAGAPIVASNVCGNPELVADGVNGLTVPFNDVEALAGAITKILERPDLAAEFVARSKERIRDFDRERLFEAKETLFREVIGDRS
jgi:glycosyltransferase involved in cell wall biosynthesis